MWRNYADHVGHMYGVRTRPDICFPSITESLTRASLPNDAYTGHPWAPYLAERGMPTHQRPPLVNGHGVPHDSTVAAPGTPNGKGKGKGKNKSPGVQTHVLL